MKTQKQIEEFVKNNKGVTIGEIMDAVPFSYDPSAYRYRLNKLRKAHDTLGKRWKDV